MLKVAKFVLPIGVLCAAIVVSQAEEKTKATSAAGKACTEQCESACSECKSCPIAKAMDALPKLVYRVGEETTTSPVQAGRLAGKLKQKAQFVVGDKVFKDEPTAFAALVDTTEAFVADFAKPHKCETSGKTFVAGKSLCCDVAAGEVASLVKKAMDDVKVTYLVGKESVCCPDEAKALAKKSGEKVVQLVAGKKCGGCSTTTRLNIAHAKYKAAVEALLAADKKAAESTEGASASTAVETASNAS